MLPALYATSAALQGYDAFSTLSALMHRQRTGQGQKVEVPMFETMAAWLMVEHLWERTLDDNGAVGYSRMLARTRKPFRTLDGYMAILPYTDQNWRDFFTLAGRQDLLDDPRYHGVVRAYFERIAPEVKA